MEYQSNKTTNLNFRSLTIEFDSHARDLASLVQQRVKSTTARRWVTGHGMHLRAAEKRLLAELIHQNLVNIDPPVSTEKEMPPPPALLKPEEPRELPFDTYAEAIKSSHIKPANGHSQCSLQSLRLQPDANCTDVSNIKNHVFRASTSSQQTKLTDPNLK
ncbi:hypothetical protein J6590_073976 [Homalodisca vitripennis]|nr:hypothetical protein J6590_073976 [Homalodisca vitripennis]